MNRLKCFSWAVLWSVAAAGCGPVAIRALEPGADGGASDVASAADAQGPGRCTLNAECPTGQYCAGNGCGTAGACASKPQGCTADYAPVCGCDGRTYANACGAAAGGSRVAAAGVCGAVDGGVDAGPGPCGDNRDCPAGAYCAGSGCGTPGECVPRPQACTLEYAPVCGCDGSTHGNACAAASSGARVSHAGPCASQDAGVDAGPGRCITSRDCPTGSYCAGDGCATPGACLPIGPPPVCDLHYDPVCTCEGATISNRCFAQYARVAHPGECAQGDGGVSGCATNRDCAAGQYCSGTGCATRGVCADRPTVCSREYAPLCGCDGQTYSNPCVAALSGVRASYSGVCGGGGDGGVTGCASATDCAGGRECVFPEGVCSARGSCELPTPCFRPETWCSCAGETYEGCRPTRPTQRTGACGGGGDGGTSRCAAALCGPGSVCCEATGDCQPLGCATCCPGASDAGVPTACMNNSQCPAGDYCAASTCGGSGRCASRPGVCTGLYAPVCGCDGQTYSNDCVAASRGVVVARAGACG